MFLVSKLNQRLNGEATMINASSRKKRTFEKLQDNLGTERMLHLVQGHPATIPSAKTEQIAILAYELWEQRGSMHGRDVEDWLEAEQAIG